MGSGVWCGKQARGARHVGARNGVSSDSAADCCWGSVVCGVTAQLVSKLRARKYIGFESIRSWWGGLRDYLVSAKGCAGVLLKQIASFVAQRLSGMLLNQAGSYSIKVSFVANIY